MESKAVKSKALEDRKSKAIKRNSKAVEDKENKVMKSKAVEEPMKKRKVVEEKNKDEKERCEEKKKRGNKVEEDKLENGKKTRNKKLSFLEEKDVSPLCDITNRSFNTSGNQARLFSMHSVPKVSRKKVSPTFCVYL